MAKRLSKEEKAAKWAGMAEFDRRICGGALLAGVDEAGRGPLAGPVAAAAVILPEGTVIEGLDDSKKLSEKKREELFDVITERALAYRVCMIGPERIDDINILNATMEAMKGAVEGLGIVPGYVIVDGNRVPELGVPCGAVVKGDSKSEAIAAASVLAKVSRDRYMRRADEEYPGYGFAKHKGYGTKEHYDAIERQGICGLHRRTFLKNVL